MALTPDARVTIGHLKTAATLHRKVSGIVLTEEQNLELERHKSQLEREASLRGEQAK